MTTLPEIALIPFHDHQIMTLRLGEVVFVVMKPVVEALDLKWNGQFERISRHPVLFEGIRIIRIPSPGGTQETMTLPLKDFHGWLVTLDTSRIKDERRRETIVRYQRESFQAIHDYWDKGRAENPRVSSFNSRPPLLALRLMKELKGESNAAVRRSIHAMLARTCEEVGIDTPSLEDIGRDAPMPPDVLVPFFAGLETLTANGAAFDHARDLDLLAINLKEVTALFAKNGVGASVTPALRKALKQSIHPAFVAIKAVCSTMTGKTVKCWVFRRNGFGFEGRFHAVNHS